MLKQDLSEVCCLPHSQIDRRTNEGHKNNCLFLAFIYIDKNGKMYLPFKTYVRIDRGEFSIIKMYSNQINSGSLE